MWRAVSVVVLAAASSAIAQQTPPSPTEIIGKQRKEASTLAAEWLQSRDAKTRAWGAYLVLRDRLKERVPDLMQSVESYEVVGEAATLYEADDHDAMLAVLDALIQMEADVPVATAAKIYPEFRAQSMILMIRSSADATTELVKIFQTETKFDGEWLAAGNKLVSARTPGFAAAVLSGMTVHARVVVTAGTGFGPGWGSGLGGSGGIVHRGGWPEIGTYSMSACGLEREVILVPGTHPAYYYRAVNNLYRADANSQCPESDSRDEVRSDYLSALLFLDHGKKAIEAKVDHRIDWISHANYLTELALFIESQQTLYSEVGKRLITARLLTESELKTSRPHLDIAIVDARQTKTTPLPKLVESRENVTFSTLF